MIRRESPNIDQRPHLDGGQGAPDILLMHYTGMTDALAAVDRLCDPAARVSAHYVIAEDGAVFQLAEEIARCWHAGISEWRGLPDVNSRSIGIEIANHGHEHGYRPFPEPQMLAVIALSQAILSRWSIAPRNVIGHSDVAPARKEDPGELFPWDLLARYRLVLAKPQLTMRLVYDNPGAFYLALERFGYDITDQRAAVRAFQRRWRPSRIDGEIDGQIGALLFELLLERDLGRAR
jgi:N-acetylmuramoyl-L-alanine amidase